MENFNAKPVNLAEAQMATPVQDQQQDDSTMFNSKVPQLQRMKKYFQGHKNCVVYHIDIYIN